MLERIFMVSSTASKLDLAFCTREVWQHQAILCTPYLISQVLPKASLKGFKSISSFIVSGRGGISETSKIFEHDRPH